VDSPGGLPGRDRIPSSATTVSDCSIHDGGIIFHSAIGVWIGDASRNRVLHNHIYNFNYSGISCGWTWGYAPACTHDNRIEGNHVHAIGHGMLSDMGAIYTLGRQAGSTISRNYIHDVYSYGYGGWGIYTDEGSSWIRIEENVVCNTKSGGLHQHYGRDNILRHNLFADAIENQIMVSRTQMMRSVTFENNLVQGAGGGRLWSTPGQHAIIDRNVYARSVGRPEKFDDKDWAGWQATGNDVHGRLSDAMMLDTRGALIAPVNDAAFNAAGIPAKRLAAVIAEAGPRLRDGLPSLDKVFRSAADKPLPIVEPLFWPWSVDWPTAANWNRFPGWESTSVPFLAHSVAGQPKVASLTLENKGAAIAKGRYRFTVIPARAAKLTGPSERTVSLKPGARQGWDITFVPTGKESTFRIEAKAEGAGLFDTCLYFSVAGTMDLPRLASKPECARLVEALSELPLRSISANPNPIKASVRLAVAEGNLLLALDVADAKPLRGEKVWEGSCVELFGAVKVGAVERQQLILAPGVGTVLPTAQRIDKNTPITAEGVEVVSVPSTTGWQLLAVIPLSTFGVEPGAASFALDLVVNAARPDGVTRASAYLASDQHPYGSTVHYLEVSVK
jgi:hypothetical protein